MLMLMLMTMLMMAVGMDSAATEMVERWLMMLMMLIIYL